MGDVIGSAAVDEVGADVALLASGGELEADGEAATAAGEIEGEATAAATGERDAEADGANGAAEGIVSFCRRRIEAPP